MPDTRLRDFIADKLAGRPTESAPERPPTRDQQLREVVNNAARGIAPENDGAPSRKVPEARELGYSPQVTELQKYLHAQGVTGLAPLPQAAQVQEEINFRGGDRGRAPTLPERAAYDALSPTQRLGVLNGDAEDVELYNQVVARVEAQQEESTE